MIDIFGDSRHLALNSLGHAAGILIFGIFLVLVFSQRASTVARQPPLPSGGSLGVGVEFGIDLGTTDGSVEYNGWAHHRRYWVLRSQPAQSRP